MRFSFVSLTVVSGQGGDHRCDPLDESWIYIHHVAASYRRGGCSRCRQVSRTHDRSTLAGNSLITLRYLKQSSVERELQQRHAAELKQILSEAGLPVMISPRYYAASFGKMMPRKHFLTPFSHIVPVIVGDARLCKAIADSLLHKHGIYVQPINYPTVPRGTERLRLTPGPLHTRPLMLKLRDALLAVWEEFGLPIDRNRAPVHAQ